jgi:hypothetical protein
MPFAVLQGCGDPFNGPQGPNGDPSADAEISVISHEASESITDPLVGGGAGSAGWADVTGNEIGDECAFTYGVPLGPNPASSLANGIAFNQVVNGHHYYIQDEFSNAAFGPGAGDVNTPTPTFFGVPPNQFQASPIQVAGCVQRPNGYQSLTPVRLFDTRTGLGGVPKRPVAGGTSISVQVAGVDGIPPDATAVALNVTGVNATAATYVTVWPDGASRPLASNLNFSNGNARPNFDVVSIGGDGKVDFFNAAGNINLLADIAGYYTTAAGYIPLTPVRLFDTRTGLGGVAKKPVAGGTFISVQVAGVDGIPPDATAVALNVTAVNATAATYVTAWPDGKPRPLASNLNVSNGNAIPNFDVVSIGGDGKVDFFNAAGSLNLLADIAGYYTQALGFNSLTPVRLFDTRTGLGGVPNKPVAGGTFISVQVAGVDGIPADATAVALNVTGVNATAATYVTVWPDAKPKPLASNLNFSDGNAAPNFDVVSIGTDGKVDFFNAAGSINLLADIAGYYR